MRLDHPHMRTLLKIRFTRFFVPVEFVVQGLLYMYSTWTLMPPSKAFVGWYHLRNTVYRVWCADKKHCTSSYISYEFGVPAFFASFWVSTWRSYESFNKGLPK